MNDRLKLFSVSEIIVPVAFETHKPKSVKMKAARDFYREHGHFDKPITLKGKVLADGYTRYLVAIEEGIENIEYVNISKEETAEYIVGLFDGCSKRYVWCNRRKLPILPGDKVLVRTKHPRCEKMIDAEVTVIEVFEDWKGNQHNRRSVLSVLENNIIEPFF